MSALWDFILWGADSDEGDAQIGMCEDLFFDWMGMAAQINKRNEMMDDYTKDALPFFRKKYPLSGVERPRNRYALW